MSAIVVRNTRPELTIECVGGRSLGRCLTLTTYRITSTRRLKREVLRALGLVGLLGFGQSREIKSPCDGKEAPVGADDSPCVEVDSTGQIVNEHPLNPYSREPYASVKSPYWTYDVDVTCDSGD